MGVSNGFFSECLGVFFGLGCFRANRLGCSYHDDLEGLSGPNKSLSENYDPYNADPNP